MTDWAQLSLEHPARSLLSRVGALIDEIDGSKPATAMQHLERLRFIVGYVDRTLTSVDAEFVPRAVLNNLQKQLQPIPAQLESFAGSRDPDVLVSANNQIENAVVAVAPLRGMLPQTTDDVMALKNAATSLRNAVRDHLQEIANERDELHRETVRLAEEVSNLSQTVTEQKARADNVISAAQQQHSASEQERQRQFSDTERKRQEQADKRAEEQGERVRALLDEVRDAEKSRREQFDQTMTGFEEALEAVLKSGDSKFKELVKDAGDNLKNTIGSFTDRATKSISELENLQKHGENIVGIITNTGMVHGYQKTANDERFAARVWQGIALTGFVGLIVFAVLIAVDAQTSEGSSGFDWPLLIGRVTAVTGFALLAAWAAQVAARHQETERRNRKMELVLASIDPYLISLSDDERSEVKRGLSERLFDTAAATEFHPTLGTRKTTGTHLDTLRLALEAINELTKKTD